MQLEFKINRRLHARALRFVDGIEITSIDHLINIAIRDYVKPKEEHEAMMKSMDMEVDEELKRPKSTDRN